MKIAALYDVHGNLPAFEAALAAASKEADLLLIGGDVAWGPMPDGVMARLGSLPLPALLIRGNGDREVVEAYDRQHGRATTGEVIDDITEWTAGRITGADRDLLASWPKSASMTVPGFGEVLFCHATPASDEELFTPQTPAAELDAMFTGARDAAVVVVGHTHVQFELSVGKRRVINAGSVGMPYADEPGAYWILLTPEGCAFRRTAYDTKRAADEVMASGMPSAGEFARENVLTVPTAAEALTIFEQQRTSA